MRRSPTRSLVALTLFGLTVACGGAEREAVTVDVTGDPAEHFLKGLEAAGARDFASAEAEIEAARQIEPSLELDLALAHVRFMRAEYGKASNGYKKYVEEVSGLRNAERQALVKEVLRIDEALEAGGRPTGPSLASSWLRGKLAALRAEASLEAESYAEAAAGYDKGYQYLSDPALLFEAALAASAAGDLNGALKKYNRYLAVGQGEIPRGRAYQVQAEIDRLEVVIAGEDPVTKASLADQIYAERRGDEEPESPPPSELAAAEADAGPVEDLSASAATKPAAMAGSSTSSDDLEDPAEASAKADEAQSAKADEPEPEPEPSASVDVSASASADAEATGGSSISKAQAKKEAAAARKAEQEAKAQAKKEAAAARKAERQAKLEEQRRAKQEAAAKRKAEREAKAQAKKEAAAKRKAEREAKAQAKKEAAAARKAEREAKLAAKKSASAATEPAGRLSASAPASAGATGGSSTSKVDDRAEAQSAKAGANPALDASLTHPAPEPEGPDLSTEPPPPTLEDLLFYAGSKSSSVRLRAVRDLTAVPDDRARQALEQRVRRDTNMRVRFAAIDALVARRSYHSIPLLRQAVITAATSQERAKLRAAIADIQEGYRF